VSSANLPCRYRVSFLVVQRVVLLSYLIRPSWSSAKKELLELQSFNEAGYIKESMQKVGEQIEEHEYTLAVADAMKEALDAYQKD